MSNVSDDTQLPAPLPAQPTYDQFIAFMNSMQAAPRLPPAAPAARVSVTPPASTPSATPRSTPTRVHRVSRGHSLSDFVSGTQTFMLHNGRLRESTVVGKNTSWVNVKIDGTDITVNIKPSNLAFRDEMRVTSRTTSSTHTVVPNEPVNPLPPADFDDVEVNDSE